jgi:hypothetical protein
MDVAAERGGEDDRGCFYSTAHISDPLVLATAKNTILFFGNWTGVYGRSSEWFRMDGLLAAVLAWHLSV